MYNSKTEEMRLPLMDLGPKFGEMYTNQELIDKSIELQRAIADTIAETTGAAFINVKDLTRTIEELASEKSLEDTGIFRRLNENLDQLGYTITSLIKGCKGESIARNALRLLQYDKGIKILYNIALEDEVSKAEYDAIVITPYGIFVVEVKNWSGDLIIDKWGLLHRKTKNEISYDVPGRMNIKECLLRECLKDLFPQKYESILLFSNKGTRVEDQYKQFRLCFGGAIVQLIRSYNNEAVLSEDQIRAIEKAVRSSHKEQYTECKINGDEIINDFIAFMSMIKSDSVKNNSPVEVYEDTFTKYESLEGKKEKRRGVGKLVREVEWTILGSVAAQVLAAIGRYAMISRATIYSNR